MATTFDDINAPGKLIYQLVVEAQNQSIGDRRADVRFAFFRPVSVHFDDGRVYSGFSREISASGIGLVHNFDIPRGELELRISHERGYWIRVRARIHWCQECGQGWFISGGQFIGTATVAS